MAPTRVLFLVLALAFSAAVRAKQQDLERRKLQDGALRLTPDEYQGLVEVYYDGAWGTICDSGFSDRTATVICRELGYAGGRAQWGAYFGEGSGPIHVTNLACKGNEASIQECPSNPWGTETGCSHADDASVVCFDEQPVRLVDGTDPGTGRLEVLSMDGSWGSVCELGWRPENTQQACKNLGYPDSLDVAAMVGGSAFGSGDVRVVMADVACSGLERYFAACSFAGWGVSGGCDPETQTVGLDCLGNIARSPGPEQSQPPEAAESSPPGLPTPPPSAPPAEGDPPPPRRPPLGPVGDGAAPPPVDEPVGSPDVPPPPIAPNAPPPRRPPMSPENTNDFAPPPDQTPDAWPPPPDSPPASPEPISDDWPPPSPPPPYLIPAPVPDPSPPPYYGSSYPPPSSPPPPYYDSGTPPPYYATPPPPPAYGPYGPPPYGNVPPPYYNHTHMPPGYPPPGGQTGHQAPPLPPFPPPDDNGGSYLNAGTIGSPPPVRPGPPGALFLELLCPPGFYATAIQTLDKDLASSLSLECISIPACANPPPPSPRTIKIHYRAPGCGPRHSRRLRGIGSMHDAMEGKLSRSTALSYTALHSISSGGQDNKHQLNGKAAQQGLGARRARTSRRMLGAAADVGAIVGNAFVLSPARLTDGAGNTFPEDLVVFFGDPMAQSNSEWLDGGESTPEYRFACADGFAATRAQAGAQAQPPTRVSFRCDADGSGAGGASSAGSWTSPELGLGNYGAQVPLSELQCPGGSRLAGLLASTRRVYEGGPLLVEAFTAYCTPACVAQ